MASRPLKEIVKLPALLPSVKRGVWRSGDANREEHDQDYSLTRRAVLERDGYTCQWCGFSTVPDRKADQKTLMASGFLEVHHIDDDHGNNTAKNLGTACPFCHAVFHVGFAGHTKRAKMIYMPWISQAQLNLLVNCLAVAMSRGSEIGDDAETLLMWFEAMDGPLVREFGEGIADPATLATALMGLHKKNPKLYEYRGKALRDVRILPDPAAFKAAIAWWSEKCWVPGTKWGSSWENIWKQWRKAKQ